MPILHYSAATVFFLKGRKRGIDAKDKNRFLEMAEQRYQAGNLCTRDI